MQSLQEPMDAHTRVDQRLCSTCTYAARYILDPKFVFSCPNQYPQVPCVRGPIPSVRYRVGSAAKQCIKIYCRNQQNRLGQCTELSMIGINKDIADCLQNSLRYYDVVDCASSPNTRKLWSTEPTISFVAGLFQAQDRTECMPLAPCSQNTHIQPLQHSTAKQFLQQQLDSNSTLHMLVVL